MQIFGSQWLEVTTMAGRRRGMLLLSLVGKPIGKFDVSAVKVTTRRQRPDVRVRSSTDCSILGYVNFSHGSYYHAYAKSHLTCRRQTAKRSDFLGPPPKAARSIDSHARHRIKVGVKSGARRRDALS
jgi:hypothetical protein